MDPESSASLKVEWERTDKSLSDLLALGGQQQQSRVASAALEAQQQRFRLWAKVIGLQDDGVDSRLNTSEMKSLLRNSRLHIADATQPDSPETAPIWSSADFLKDWIKYFDTIQQQLQLFLRDGQSQELRRTTRELALKLLWPDSPSELEYKEAACKISMKEDSKRLQELLSLIQSRRKLIDIEAADQSLSSLGEARGSRAYEKRSENLRDLWDDTTPATIGTWKAGESRHVYVEWKDLSSEKSSERKEAMWKRIQDLGDVLSSNAGLNVLPFLALTRQGADHWGFVYELPESTRLDAKNQTMPSTLHYLLGQQYRPSLSARVHLALSLATSLLNFHLIGWLHKGIRSEHVMFFPKNPSQRSLIRPCWVGLTYARGDTEFDRSFSERTASDELYCHPRYKQDSHKNFCRQYDYYALGALLLEIGQWDALDKICNEQIRSAPSQDVNLLDAVTHGSDGRNLLTRLRYNAGDIYHDVVKTCLTGNFEVAEAAPARDWHLAFFRRIVLELERCVI